jgi:RNA polymerase sigma-70 factor (ECF subfamily)
MSDASAELLERARAGDHGALEALLDRHEAQVYRFGLKMCRDPEDAKDVLQDTLLAMARSVHGFRGASSLSTWLYAIARSFCLKKRRRSKHAPAQERSLESEAAKEAQALADPGRAPDEEVAGRQVEHALEQAIAALEPMYREVLILRDIEGLTAPEVAEVLGVSVQAVKSRLHRARLSVRSRVAPLLGIPVEPAAPGTCPDVLMLLSRHLEDEISQDVCTAMERHLETCGRCRGACESLKRTLALCSTAPGAEVPREVQESVRAAIRGVLAEQP